MTKTLAVEWGPYNVRVNGIYPGAIAGTEGYERLGNMSLMNDKDATKKARENNATSAGSNTFDLYPVPSQRVGEVEDIANTALFLASDGAHYITGTNILVDGGAVLTAPNAMFSNAQYVKMWQQAKL